MVLLAIVLVTGIFPTNLHADTRTPHELLQDLASPDYTTRRTATQQLIINNNLKLQSIKDLFAQTQSPEQQHRLLRIAEHHLLRETLLSWPKSNPAGALGITHRPLGRNKFPQLDRAAIMVVSTLPGFPANGVLQPGDLILSIGDDRIPPTFTAEQVSHKFIQTIRQHQAGSLINLTILRNDKQTTASVKLAHLTALQKMYNANKGTLTATYRHQVDALTKELQQQITPPTQITSNSKNNQDQR